MFLNLDMCHAVIREILPLLPEEIEFLPRFILSGKESMISLERMMHKAETIELAHIDFNTCNTSSSSFYYFIRFNEVSWFITAGVIVYYYRETQFLSVHCLSFLTLSRSFAGPCLRSEKLSLIPRKCSPKSLQI